MTHHLAYMRFSQTDITDIRMSPLPRMITRSLLEASVFDHRFLVSLVTAHIEDGGATTYGEYSLADLPRH